MMNRELLILRHGKADKHTQCADYVRPLHDKGKRAAQRVGVWLASHDLTPDHIISSPAERALVSAEKASKAMGRYVGAIVTDQRVYNADLDTLLAVLGECANTDKRVLLVGHNPGLEDLLSHLVSEELPRSRKGKLLPPGALARLSMPASWTHLAAGSARLTELVYPEQLPKKFPFPDHNGSDRRDRPAYYYTQSSVIPYRLHDGEPEILLIQSSQKKHFVVPKGIKEPALSPQQSAAREALEEAGAEGRVHDDAIGSYQYEKWGACCTVDVYPMEVARLLAENVWQESHRGREWVSPEVAARRLKQDELAPLVLALADSLRAG